MQLFADLQRDLRYAMAGLLRHPLFAASAVATIGLGIGAATSVFNVVDSIYLRRLPVPSADRLVRVEFHRPGGNPALGLAGIDILRERATAFDAVIAHASRNVLFVRVGNRSIEQHGAFVSANYWPTLGITPRLGRFFAASEDSVPDRDAIVVVSSAFWHTHLGDDPAVIGRHIGVMGRDVTIIRVAPEGFQGVSVGQMPNDLWLPMAMASLRRAMSSVDPLVLVTESMSMRAQIAANFVQIRIGQAVLLASAGLALFLCGVGLYGVIAFLVARRTREVGIRLALGAPVSSVTGLFVRHGMRSVAVGTVAGLALAFVGTRLLAAWLVGIAPNDATSFGVAAGAVVGVSLLASYLPARRASRTDPAVALRVE